MGADETDGNTLSATWMMIEVTLMNLLPERETISHHDRVSFLQNIYTTKRMIENDPRPERVQRGTIRSRVQTKPKAESLNQEPTKNFRFLVDILVIGFTILDIIG